MSQSQKPYASVSPTTAYNTGHAIGTANKPCPMPSYDKPAVIHNKEVQGWTDATKKGK